jgi:hypothetical protein
VCRWLRREAERCQGCGTFRNLYVSVEANTGRWMCNFCGHVTKSDDLKGKESIEACRELRDAVVSCSVPPSDSFQSAMGCLHVYCACSFCFGGVREAEEGVRFGWGRLLTGWRYGRWNTSNPSQVCGAQIWGATRIYL